MCLSYEERNCAAGCAAGCMPDSRTGDGVRHAGKLLQQEPAAKTLSSHFHVRRGQVGKVVVDCYIAPAARRS